MNLFIHPNFYSFIYAPSTNFFSYIHHYSFIQFFIHIHHSFIHFSYIHASYPIQSSIHGSITTSMVNVPFSTSETRLFRSELVFVFLNLEKIFRTMWSWTKFEIVSDDFRGIYCTFRLSTPPPSPSVRCFPPANLDVADRTKVISNLDMDKS